MKRRFVLCSFLLAIIPMGLLAQEYPYDPDAVPNLALSSQIRFGYRILFFPNYDFMSFRTPDNTGKEMAKYNWRLQYWVGKHPDFQPVGLDLSQLYVRIDLSRTTLDRPIQPWVEEAMRARMAAADTGAAAAAAPAAAPAAKSPDPAVPAATAASRNGMDAFRSPNYLWLDTLASDASTLIREFESRTEERLAMLYVSGCALDEEALPAFQAMSQRHPDILFLRIGQFSSTRAYMAEHYGVTGAPRIMILKNKVSFDGIAGYFDTVNGTTGFIGWERSIQRWEKTVLPHYKPLATLSNVHPLNDGSYQDLMKGKRTVLFRFLGQEESMKVDMTAFNAMAAKFPGTTFLLDPGVAAGFGETGSKYLRNLYGFSIVQDVDTIVSTFRRTYQATDYDYTALETWLSNALTLRPVPPEPQIQPIPVNAGPDALVATFRNHDMNPVVIMQPDQFRHLAKGGSNLNAIEAYDLLYLVPAAALNRNCHPETARQLLELLEFESRGGIGKALGTRPMIFNWHAQGFQRMIRHETRPAVRQQLERLLQLYKAHFPIEKSPVVSAPLDTTSRQAYPGLTLNQGVGVLDFAGPMEIEVVAELNLVRNNPTAYVRYLEDYRGHISGNELRLPGRNRIILKEGILAVNEAIQALKRSQPLPVLSLSRGLTLSARDHARDLVRNSMTGHTGSDGSKVGIRANRHGAWQRAVGENISYGATSARDIVIGLLVDDGVPDRGHRTIILSPAYLTVGIALEYQHPNYGQVCVQNFAAQYQEKTSP